MTTRHPPTPRSASGRAMRHSPAPNAPGGADERDREGTRPRGHLLGGDDHHEQPAGRRQPSHDGLRDAERDQVGREAAERGDHAAEPRTGEQHPTAALAVGQRGQRERTEDADADRRQRGPLLGLGGVELVGRERDRLAQERADVAEDDGERAERPERGGGVAVGRLRGRPPRSRAGRQEGVAVQRPRRGTATPSGRARSRSARTRPRPGRCAGCARSGRTGPGRRGTGRSRRPPPPRRHRVAGGPARSRPRAVSG